MRNSFIVYINMILMDSIFLQQPSDNYYKTHTIIVAWVFSVSRNIPIGTSDDLQSKRNRERHQGIMKVVFRTVPSVSDIMDVGNLKYRV